MIRVPARAVLAEAGMELAGLLTIKGRYPVLGRSALQRAKSADLVTHMLLTCQLIGKHRNVPVASIAPDLPFYLTDPAWAVGQGDALDAPTTNHWPR